MLLISCWVYIHRNFICDSVNKTTNTSDKNGLMCEKIKLIDKTHIPEEDKMKNLNMIKASAASA